MYIQTREVLKITLVGRDDNILEQIFNRDINSTPAINNGTINDSVTAVHAPTSTASKSDKIAASDIGLIVIFGALGFFGLLAVIGSLSAIPSSTLREHRASQRRTHGNNSFQRVPTTATTRSSRGRSSLMPPLVPKGPPRRSTPSSGSSSNPRSPPSSSTANLAEPLPPYNSVEMQPVSPQAPTPVARRGRQQVDTDFRPVTPPPRYDQRVFDGLHRDDMDVENGEDGLYDLEPAPLYTRPRVPMTEIDPVTQWRTGFRSNN